MACLEYTFWILKKKLSGLVVDITILWRYYYCPLEAILLSIGGTFFVPEMLPEATENFFKKMKVIHIITRKWSIFL